MKNVWYFIWLKSLCTTILIYSNYFIYGMTLLGGSYEKYFILLIPLPLLHFVMHRKHRRAIDFRRRIMYVSYGICTLFRV